MTFQDFLMNSPSGGLMIKVGDGTPIGGLPPWIASDTVNGGLMFKVNGAGYTPPDGMLQTGTALNATLQVVNDNVGTNSVLQLSTAQAAIGTYTAASYASAKLIVGNYASANSEVANIGIMAVSQATLNSATAYGYAVYGHGYTNGSARSAGLVGEGKVTVTGDTGSAIGVRGYANDTHAGGFNIGLYGDATGGSSNYALYMAAGDIYSAVTNQIWNYQTSLDFQVGGVSKVKFDNNGKVTAIGFSSPTGVSRLGNLQFNSASSTQIETTNGGSDAAIQLTSSGFLINYVPTIKLGGTTSSFPAIKRNGAAIDFRLADDSGYCDISAGQILASTNVYAGSGSSIGVLNNFRIFGSGTGIAKITDGTATDFNRLQLGGTTSAYPSIKRNGAAIDFRLADDSGYAAVTAAEGSKLGLITFDSNGSGRGRIYGVEQIAAQSSNGIRIVASQDSANINATAILQVDSTTKGVLFPRMTTTQKNAISTPATGLVVFDTTLVKLAVYNGAAWETVTSV